MSSRLAIVGLLFLLLIVLGSSAIHKALKATPRLAEAPSTVPVIDARQLEAEEVLKRCANQPALLFFGVAPLSTERRLQCLQSDDATPLSEQEVRQLKRQASSRQEDCPDPARYYESCFQKLHSDARIRCTTLKRAHARQLLAGQPLARGWDKLATHYKLWRSQRGFTPMHADGVHNLALQLTGSKCWILCAPRYAPVCCEYKRDGGHRPFYKAADPRDRSTALAACPSFAQVKTLTVSVPPGFGLYVPPRWLHAVETLDDNSLMLNLLWSDAKNKKPTKPS